MTRAAGLLAALVWALGLAPMAGAATVSVDGQAIRYAGGDGRDRIAIAASGADYVFTALDGHEGGLSAGGGCIGSGPVTCSSTVGGGRRFAIATGAGEDAIAFDGPVVNGADVFTGAGPDTIEGTPVADTIDGGADEDEIDPGQGADGVEGGDGHDRVAYSTRAAGVTVTLDDQANDGEAGEGDNIHSNVEDLTGGGGNDVLTGDGSSNTLDGGAGNDTLTGGPGSDRLLGNVGDDVIEAGDSEADAIECGPGTDSATIDGNDTPVRDCEVVRNVDADGDFYKVGADCNDANPRINPGAVDVPENGIDEDCDGVDAGNFDRDADGIQRPLDCNDADPAIRPGLPEVAGNAADENCDGVVAPFPPVTFELLDQWRFFRAYTRNTRLLVRRVPSGGRVELRCRGRGCPRGVRSVRPRRGQVNLTPALRGRRLRVGAVVEVRIVAPGMIGRVVRYLVRPARAPRATVLCLAPGARTPRRCG